MKNEESAWAKGNHLRKSYAAASSVTLPKPQKSTQKLSTILGNSNASRNDRNRRYRQQRSAFGSEEREKERQLRKEKYAKVEKTCISLEKLLEIRKTMTLERLVILNAEEFEGLQREQEDALLPVLEESFDAKKHTTEWYETVKKDRIEKTKRFHEREREKSNQKPQNVWRSPAWNNEPAPAETPEVLDLEKLSKMTADMTKEPKKEVFELSDMSKQAQKFEEENRKKEEKRDVEMPSFFQTEQQQDGLDEILNTALEDVSRPPPEEIVPDVSLPVEETVALEVEHEQRERERERLWRQQEYYRREEEYRLRLQRQQQQQQERRFAPTEPEWFYRDPHGNIQGPYNSQTMRTWLERKFFKDDLPIAQNSPRNGFVPIRHLFPDPRTAFLHIPPQPMSRFPPQPRQMPPQNYFNQRRSEEAPLDRLSAFDLEKLQSQTQVKEEESSFTDFLDLDQPSFQAAVEKEEKAMTPPVEEPVVKKKKKKKKKVGDLPLPQKLEGLSDNLKKMLGVTKKKEKKPQPPTPTPVPAPVSTAAASANPWKQTEPIKTGQSLRKIQEEEQQKLKQDILNGTHQPSQSKVWANLVAKNAHQQVSQRLQQQTTGGGQGLSQEKYKKFLSWYKTSCIGLKIGFDERLFTMGVSLEKPSDIRQLFKKHLGSDPKIAKFTTEFLNMKEKLSN